MKLHVLGLLFLGLVAGQDDQAAGDALDARISAERAKIRNDFPKYKKTFGDNFRNTRPLEFKSFSLEAIAAYTCETMLDTRGSSIEWPKNFPN